MARSINSPGVQITEKDLSQFIEPTVGTNVYAMGYAAQGPTDEVILLTSASELETIYGIPETPAERYFHYTCREILNSQANLLTTRLPYGSGSGSGFTNQYSALFFPVASGSGQFELREPAHITLTEAQYQAILQGDVTWSPLAGTAATYNAETKTINAGVVILNSSQTTVNEGYEGYYVAVTDNKDIGPDTDFTSINTFKSLSANGALVTVPETRLSFELSATKAQLGTNSISEIIEGIPTYDFGSDYYKDSIIVTVYKVRSSIYESGTLAATLAETHVGSLDPKKRTITGTGAETFYIENIINNNSNNIRILLNPSIVKTNWTELSSSNPSTAVRVANNNKAMYAAGTFVPTYLAANKFVGDVRTKVQRALTLVESPELVELDVIVDGGLSTISAVVSATGGSAEYDDSIFINTAELSNSSSNLAARWRNVFNVFNNFVENNRKDCMFISDPLRNIFVNGYDVKTTSKTDYTFSTDIYTPLKNLFSGVETNYSATYGNWVKVFDTYKDNRFWAPFSGFAAAAFARTDATAQPWIAPAGLTRGIVNNVVDIAFNPNQKQRDFLYPISINPVVFFSNGGYVIYGQKTLQTRPSAFDRINVRRLFLALEKAVLSATRFFVFEPNTEFTRTRLVNTISPVFENAKNTDGLFDYLIVCDERNNTPDTIDRNELNVDIYIKPVRAAEFILVNFIATRTGQNFSELL